MTLQYAKFQMANERERNPSHYISVVAIEILILGQHSSVCTVKAYEKGSCKRVFEVEGNFVLKLTFQHTKS